MSEHERERAQSLPESRDNAAASSSATNQNNKANHMHNPAHPYTFGGNQGTAGTGKFYWSRKGSASSLSSSQRSAVSPARGDISSCAPATAGREETASESGGGGKGNSIPTIPSAPRTVARLSPRSVLGGVAGGAALMAHPYTLSSPPFARSNSQTAHDELSPSKNIAPSEKCASDDSGDEIAMPREQEASERPVLFHRVERWLNEEAFSLEVQDFELHHSGGSLGNGPKRPGTAPFRRENASSQQDCVEGSSPARFAERYRKTVESYSRQNEWNSAEPSKRPLFAVDDLGFDSMLPRATHIQSDRNVEPKASGVKKDNDLPASPVMASPVRPVSSEAQNESRRRVKAATERLWRNRMKALRNRNRLRDHSSSEETSSLSSSDDDSS